MEKIAQISQVGRMWPTFSCGPNMLNMDYTQMMTTHTRQESSPHQVRAMQPIFRTTCPKYLGNSFSVEKTTHLSCLTVILKTRMWPTLWTINSHQLTLRSARDDISVCHPIGSISEMVLQLCSVFFFFLFLQETEAGEGTGRNVVADQVGGSSV